MYELVLAAALLHADLTEVQRFREPFRFNQSGPRFRDPRPYRDPRFRGSFDFRFGPRYPRYPRYVPRYYDPYFDDPYFDPYWRWRWRPRRY